MSLSAAGDTPPAQGASGAGPKQAITLIVAAFLPIMAIVSMVAAVPTILDNFRDVPNAKVLVPLIVSAPGLTIALLAPFAGIVTDKVGRRGLLVWSTGLYGAVGIAPIFLDNIYAILGSRLLLGVAEAGILTTVNTLIADYWDQSGRRRVLLIQGLAGPAFATGVIALAGLLTSFWWKGVFLVYLIAFPIFLAMWLWMYEPRPEGAASKDAGSPAAPAATRFPWASVAAIGLVTLFCSTLYYVFIIQGGLAFREVGVLSPAEIGATIGLGSLAVPVGAILFGLTGKRAPGIQIFTFLTFTNLGLLGMGLAANRDQMFAALVIQQVGQGMAVPVLIAWAQSQLSFEHRGRGMGVWTCAFFLGQFSSPLVVGLVRGGEGSVQTAFATLGAIGLAGALAALAVGLRSRRGAVAPSTPAASGA